MAKLLDDVVGEFSRLPGIGRRTALRLAMHLLRMEEHDVELMSRAILRFRTEIRYCSCCNNLSDGDKCKICSDPTRDHSLVCVVEQVKDVLSIEQTRQYEGVYHVLGGALSPLEGIGPDDLHIAELLARLNDPTISEVILATNPNIEGETTASYLARLIKPLGVKVSRLASGLPVGGDLEFADEVTLGRAIEARREL